LLDAAEVPDPVEDVDAAPEPDPEFDADPEFDVDPLPPSDEDVAAAGFSEPPLDSPPLAGGLEPPLPA